MGRGDKIAEAWINSDERRLFHGAWRSFRKAHGIPAHPPYVSMALIIILKLMLFLCNLYVTNSLLH